MKLLELCLSPDLGGLELYMLRASAALSETDQVLALVAPGGRLDQRFAQAQLQARPFVSRSRKFPLLAARELAAIIDHERVDTIHLHWGNDLPLAALAKLFSRRKPRLVYTRQMLITRGKRDPWHRLLYGQMDLMLTITRDLENSARGFLPKGRRIETLYYGVEAPRTLLTPQERDALRTELGLPADGFVVGLFGRIEHAKGQHLLIEALAQAAQRGEALYGLVVGHAMDESYRTQLLAQAQAAGLEQRVVFSDFVPEPQRLMQACDAVALTTYRETFGLVLVEAMRAGVAVVGAASGGVPEIIDDGETGLLFQPGDAESLHVALAQLARRPQLRAQLAAAGRAKADRMFDAADHFRTLREKLLP